MLPKTIFTVFILISNASFAQSTSTLMGANIAGIGYASSTIDDAWSLFNNVAGMARINQFNTSFAYEARAGLIGANRMAASIISPSKIATFGIGVFRFGDDIYNEHQLSIGAANQIGNTSLGVKINYTQYRAENYGISTAISIDFGGITRITQQLSIGAYITNLTQSSLQETDGQRLPTKLVVGIGFRPSDQILAVTEIEKDIDYKATWRSGVEYSIYKKVFFRTGFNLNPNAAYIGLGAQKKSLKFDYAIKFNQLLGASHQVSAIYFIPSKVRK